MPHFLSSPVSFSFSGSLWVTMQASADPWRDGCSGQIGTSLVRVLRRGAGKSGAWRDGSSKRRRPETLRRARSSGGRGKQRTETGSEDRGEWRLLDLMDRDPAWYWDC